MALADGIVVCGLRAIGDVRLAQPFQIGHQKLRFRGVLDYDLQRPHQLLLLLGHVRVLEQSLHLRVALEQLTIESRS